VQLGEPLERSAPQLAERLRHAPRASRAVPATTVVGRRVAPCAWTAPPGAASGGCAPVRPSRCQAGSRPGGLVRPFAVLAQEGMRARWFAVPGDGGGLLVEGVAGFGDEFMLARAAPARLPERVVDDVRRVGLRATVALGLIRFEWAHDGDRSWMLQLHLATAAPSATAIHPGTASRWHGIDPSLGLERLRELIVAVGQVEHAEVAGDIGVTSHTGELLRWAAIPSKLAGPSKSR
jgi:hypothetical protein